MSAPILATKLFIPRPRPRAVQRLRLVERLDEARELALVSAPAGFGKTSVVAEWVERRQAGDPRLAVGWLSLDEGDGDPFRFLLYFAASLQGVDPNCGADALAALLSPSPPSARSVLVDLINEIDGLARDMLLVLDDYHAIDSPMVDTELAFLVDNLPSRMRLVVVTREDPDLPLARLRAKGELTELRAADLRFTSEEAADFLGRAMGLRLKPEEVAALEARTEGWIAGLQLAAVSMRGVSDISGFIASFAGSHRFVLDYLVEEVLRRESEGVQSFLVRTSILDRFCGPLCDALTGGPGATGMLEYLERVNLFVVPLDDERRWYRYHRLFAELLRQRLGQGEPAFVSELHVRASAWLEENGLLIEAFRHAAQAGDHERAERLAESRGMPIYFRGAVIAILEWLASLPVRTLDERPSLRVLYATMSLVAGRTAGVEEALDAAQSAVASASSEAEDTKAKNRGLLGRIAAARATLAVTRYQPDEVLRHSSRAFEYLLPDDLQFRMTATWAEAVAHLLNGEREGTVRSFADLESMSLAAEDPFFLQLALCGLAESQEQDTRLHEAAQTYRRALDSFGEHPQPNASEAHLGLARILYQWNELDAAQVEAERGLHLARQYDSAIDRFILCELELARIKIAKGLAAAVAAKLDDLENAARSRGFLHRVPAIAGLRVEALMRLGRTEEAARVADRYDLPAAKARVFMACGECDSALALLASLSREMWSRHWKDEYLKVLVLQALALQGTGQGDEAIRLAGEAAGLAEAGGSLRLFLDEGEPMAALVAAVDSRGKSAYAGRILSAFEAERRHRGDSESRVSSLHAQALLDPLSERELEVLRLVAEGLSNQEIGERLFLALDTIKGHNRRIFDKLDVKRRTEAIARSRELGLL